RGSHGKPFPASRRAPTVAGLVRDDPQQPRADRRPVTKAREGGIGLEEGILDGIVGIGLRADEVRGPQGDVLVAAHELLVRRDVTDAGARDQFGVFDVDGPSAVNRTSYTGRGSKVPGR